ncbi:MAG: tRNA dihydrouridine synthase DusB [Thermoanaerobaculales bacterium]|nr:tRNA dihydrouridine synthase DusB [Thermoanaerobaculales bacterium]
MKQFSAPQAMMLGPIEVRPPVVLAPMAGITNYPFRRLCRRYGAGLFISEMITARPLVEGREKTLKLAAFGPDETPRSLQLYGTDPHYVSLAVQRLVTEGTIDHIDLNFGCPVRKVTRKGGGAAIPARPALLRSIVRAAVTNAGDVPVTLKFRMGINDQLMTFLESGRIAEGEGCAAVTLHARTAAQLYDGQARWEAIGELVQALAIPVFGNGDIWVAADAIRMLKETGCAGVAVGRGCLGRPWIFRDLAAVLQGHPTPDQPTFGEVADIMLEHARLLVDWFGERSAMLAFRKHSGWYTRGFRNSAVLRDRLMRARTLVDLENCLAPRDREESYPENAHLVRRGKRGGSQKVVLPHGFLDDPDYESPPCAENEDGVSGG